MLMWGITILFAVISLVLLSGRGSFLIAGYNTASKADKSRYDEKKLCRVVGGGFGIITIFLAVQAAYGENLPKGLVNCFSFAALGIAVVLVILSNTICKVKDGEAKVTEDTKEADVKKSQQEAKILKGSGIFTIVLLVLVGIMLTTGNIKVTVEENVLNIEGSYWPNHQIKLDEIQSVTYRDKFQVGSRVGGLGSFRLLEGNFNNSEFGNYTLYAYTKCKEYVVLETSGKMLVLNGKTPEETEKLYEMILSETEAD